MNFESSIRQNNLRVYLAMALLTTILSVLWVVVSHLFGFGLTGTSSFIFLSVVINIIAYFFSDKIVLRSSGAKPITRAQVPELFEIVDRLALSHAIPSPRLFLLNETRMNAFATGRNCTHSAIAVTRWLLEKMNKTEVEAVMAHEFSHILNADIRLMTVVSVLGGIISIFADMFWYSNLGSSAQEKDRSGVLAWIGLGIAIFAPLTAFFIQLVISRNREFVADATAAKITSNPLGLASALKKIQLDMRLPSHINRATAHLYFSTQKQWEGFIDRLFSTHPPVEERIKRLESFLM